MKDFKSFHSAFQTLVKALLAVSLLHLALFSESEHPPLSPHTKKASTRVLKNLRCHLCLAVLVTA